MGADSELRVHRDWIGALQPVGLVVSAPALHAAQASPDQNVLEKRAALLALMKPRGAQETEKEWAKRKPAAVRFPDLARTVLGWREGKLVAPPESLGVVLPTFNETLRPTYAVRALPEEEGEWMMLVQVVPDGAGLDDAPEESNHKRWHASPQVRLERLLKETGVAVGVLINGAQVRLVYAPRGESSGHVTWPLWSLCQASHKEGLAALCMLLGAARLFSLGREQRLLHILRESRKYQNVVSTKLAGQVLEALNELLRGFQAANDRAKGRLLDDTVTEDPDHIYGGLLAVLLRLVFVLYAEERGMLSASAAYVRNYSLVGLFEKLRVDAGRYPDTMDDRYGAWSRLLVLFRMIYDGARRGDLRLPARYGHLFDPNGWAFLEGRPYKIERVMGAPVEVPKVPDGVVYRVLEKLLLLDGERLSYRALDVEQIGSVYENMMGFRVERAVETSIGVGKDHVVVGLDTLLAKKGGEREKHLKEVAGVELTGKAAEALKKAASIEDLVASLGRRISVLTPRTVPGGGIYLQPTEERRRSGSHYTPQALTEPIVRTTLRPVLEALGENPEPKDILALKICDPAMGSGAFLVEACRQLGVALVAAWSQPDQMPAIPPDEDTELHARRLIAQRCLYGVDKNPFAVELAKLSIWLVTLAKEHPLTFVDHALLQGDSLVGLSSEQIYNLAFDPAKGGKLAPQERNSLLNAVRRAEKLRGELHELGDSDDTTEKRRLWAEAEGALDAVRLVGDVMVASFFLEGSDKERKKALENLGKKVPAWVQKRDNQGELRGMTAELRSGDKGVTPFHWEIEFPEVWGRANGGFDCMVGNPPFLGGKRISGTLGDHYRDWLGVSHESSSNADLVAHFFRGTFGALRNGGTLGFVATNSIAQGDTRATGLRCICLQGGLIYNATRRLKWPGTAAVVVSIVHVAKRAAQRTAILDGRYVPRITAYLFHTGGDQDPARLMSNADKSYIGCDIKGQGFLFADADEDCTSLEEMRRILSRNRRNNERVFPYLGGEDLNNSPNCAAPRYVISFDEMSLEEASTWPDLLSIVESKVRPTRAKKSADVASIPWWQFWRVRRELYKAISGLSRVLVIARVSRTCAFTVVDAKQIFNEKVVVFPFASLRPFAILQSRVHEGWARFFSSTLKDDLQYTPSDCFETFPFPPDGESNANLEAIGKAYYDFRAALMIRNTEGLTTIYNRFHEPDEQDADILQLRALHAAMDRAVLDAYGWTDLQPTCDFLLDYEEPDDEDAPGPRRKKKPWRYRWPDDLRDEVLARLLALNAQRAGEEAAASLAAAPAAKPAKKPQTKLFRGEDK